MKPQAISRSVILTLSGLCATILLMTCSPNTVDPKNHGTKVLDAFNRSVFEMAVAEDGLLTLKGLRTAAMMHVAAHDALNSIAPVYTPYTFESASSASLPELSVAYAMHTVAVGQYPDQKSVLDSLLGQWTTEIPESQITQAKALGEAAASAIIDLRQDDGWNGEAEYTWHPMAPGVYAEFNEHSGTPEGFVFGAGWAQAKTFLLQKADQFRSPPPPDIQSAAYATAFDEVKSFGSENSEVRSQDQRHLALWWKDFVENSHNRLARQLIVQETLDLWQAARVYALLNMTVYDAYINVFDNKFHYNHWRPYTAIRWAEHDGNDATEADPDWNNLHQHTYAFPSYPSAHGTASSAAMTVLAATLGTGDTYGFTMVTETVDSSGPFSPTLYMDPPTRSFDSFSQAGYEAAISRVYLGIHFRYDSEEGHRLGNTIGAYANSNYLLPIHE
ncbi:vanadium-dependent haloperoxidase [Flagellimonas sp. DF-77]|uniref:vanadium-dependent haloperoxidase n=1 Tax=Flagellimonas algarum TaxID=3230298 RepID=UPI00339B3ED2